MKRSTAFPAAKHGRPSGRRRSATASPRRTWSSAFRATERLAQRAFNLTHHPVRGRGLTHAALAKRADGRRARRDGEEFGILERAHLATDLIERQVGDAVVFRSAGSRVRKACVSTV